MSYLSDATIKGKSDAFKVLYTNVEQAMKDRAELGHTTISLKALGMITRNYGVETVDTLYNKLREEGYVVNGLWVSWKQTPVVTKMEGPITPPNRDNW